MEKRKQAKNVAAKVISMVPSWTETLLEAGVNIVGRTRFCIHPNNQVRSIPRVGGTKDIRWDLISAMGADYLLLDKEENPLWMAAQSPIPTVVTHVESVKSLERDLRMLAETFQAQQLEYMARRLKILCDKKLFARDLTRLPGVLTWIKKPVLAVEKVIYIIWKNPWMIVSANTFIGSVFEHLGYGLLWSPDESSESRYPKIELEKIADERTLLLFSSEPYNFVKEQSELANVFRSPMALVHGEHFSWFGIRTLRFLEEAHRASEIFS